MLVRIKASGCVEDIYPKELAQSFIRNGVGEKVLSFVPIGVPQAKVVQETAAFTPREQAVQFERTPKGHRKPR